MILVDIDGTKFMIVNVISESEYFPKGHGVHTAYLNMVEMLRRKGVEVLINSKKKADITHIHTVGPFAIYKLLTSEKTVISTHVVPASFVGSLIGAKHWRGVAADYLKFVYNKADLVLAVAPAVKEELLKIGVTMHIEVFPNPVDTKVFREDQELKILGQRKLGVKKDEFVVLGVGQIQPRKGIDDFVFVASILPNLKFVWVGTKPMKGLTAQSEK